MFIDDSIEDKTKFLEKITERKLNPLNYETIYEIKCNHIERNNYIAAT